MRNSWMLAMVVAASGCGLLEKPYDKNHDGLIGACEGLSRLGCNATPGCVGEELACIQICRSNGNGGCLPCEAFECVPSAPPPCESLAGAQCSNDARCELSDACTWAALCLDDGHGGCKPCAPAACHPRPTQLDCSQIAVSICPLISACEVTTVVECSGTTLPVDVSDDGGHPKDCGGGGGGGGCTAVQVCGNKVKPPKSCEETPIDQCDANPACEHQVTGNVCDFACSDDSPCPPCAQPIDRCVTKVVDFCGARSIDSCEADSSCTRVDSYCALVCQDDGKGGCVPCAPSRCVASAVEPVDAGSPEDAPPPIR